jgi:hypothetical protein
MSQKIGPPNFCLKKIKTKAFRFGQTDGRDAISACRVSTTLPRQRMTNVMDKTLCIRDNSSSRSSVVVFPEAGRGGLSGAGGADQCAAAAQASFFCCKYSDWVLDRLRRLWGGCLATR